jgi:hypothetical protein
MLRFTTVSLIFAALAGCGSSGTGSGVSGDKKLNALGSMERDMVCSYVVNTEGVRTKMCGNVRVTSLSTAQCIASLVSVTTSCTATVDTAESCAESGVDDLCQLVSSPSCIALIACASTASMPTGVVAVE